MQTDVQVYKDVMMAYKGIEIIIIVYKRHLFTKSLKKSVSKFSYSSASLTSLVSLSTLKTINSSTKRSSSLSRSSSSCLSSISSSIRVCFRGKRGDSAFAEIYL